MFYDNIINQGFSGSGPEFTAHAANVETALKRCDTASSARKSADRKLLHYYVSSVGLGGIERRADRVRALAEARWRTPGTPMPAGYVRRVRRSRTLIATATVLHDGAARTHNVA